MSSDNDADKTGVEPDLLPLGTLTAWVVGLSALVFLLVVGVWQYFQRAIQHELLIKDLSRANPALVETSAQDQKALSTYALLDEKSGKYRLAIDRAMDLLVADPTLIHPLAAPAPQAAPAAPPAAPAPQAAPAAPPAAPAPQAAPAAKPTAAVPAAPAKPASTPQSPAPAAAKPTHAGAATPAPTAAPQAAPAADANSER